MQTLSVLSPVGNNVIAKLTPKGETFAVKFTPFAISKGFIFGSSTRWDIINAALYLAREHAAVSCRCNGYTVTK